MRETVDYGKQCGSFGQGDCAFVLNFGKPIRQMDIAEKEELARSGAAHYGQMLGKEEIPAPAMSDLFAKACARNGERLGACIRGMAEELASRKQGRCALVSLARAGTPIGVALKKVLDAMGAGCAHYSASAVRGYGLDRKAMEWILQRESPESVAFVDGWTGKGGMAREVEKTAQALGIAGLDAGLWTVSDPAGAGAYSCDAGDWLIPNAALNATASGLASRSYLDPDDPEAMHCAMWLGDLAPFDASRSYAEFLAAKALQARPAALLDGKALAQAAEQTAWLARVLASERGIESPGRIKLGIGESTRALLRREAQELLVCDFSDPDCAHLLELAKQKGVRACLRPDMPRKACAVVK